MSSGNDFDRELERRFSGYGGTAGERGVEEAQARQHEMEAQRHQAEARRHEVESDWERSQEVRERVARTLTESNVPAKQLVIRKHLATKKKFLGKEETFWMIDEAVDGWLIENGEINPYEATDAIYDDRNPIIWRSTYLLTDSDIAVTFVDASKYRGRNVALRYYDLSKGIPSPDLIPREIRVVRNTAELVELVTSDPGYRLPDNDSFIGAIKNAARRLY